MADTILPISKATQQQAEIYNDYKLERLKDAPVKIVDRKSNVPSAREEIPREQVEKAAEKLNRMMGIIDKKLQFTVHEKSNRIMVKVIDTKTDEVLEEIPSKKILDMLSSFTDIIGLMVDKRV